MLRVLWRQEHNARLLFAVHHNLQGMVEADMAHVFGFFDSGHPVEDILLEDTIACIGIDGEIADTETGEILEEMRSLGGVDVIILQTRFHNDAGSGDMRPLDRDAQPVVAASPASRPNEHIILVLIEELLVDLLDVRRDGGIVGGGEILIGLDIDHIHHILRDTMSQ